MRAVHGAWFAALAASVVGGCALVASLPDVHLGSTGGGGAAGGTGGDPGGGGLGGASNSTGVATATGGAGGLGGAGGALASSSQSTGTNNSATPSSGAGGCMSTYEAVILADHPVGYWRLGETSGTVANAVVGMKGTYSNGVTLGAAGAIGCDADTAAHFDGQDDCVDLGVVLPFAGSLPFSVEAWVNPKSIVNPLSNHDRIVNREAPDAAVKKQGWNLVFDTSGVLMRRFLDDTADIAYGPVLDLDVWTHVVGTFDGSKMMVYENGVPASGIMSTKVIKDASAPLLIGAEFRPGSGGNIDGEIDEVAIYDRALTLAEVTSHYQAGTH